MTLDTTVRVAGDIDHKELFYIAIKALLDAAGREDDLSAVEVRYEEKGLLPEWVHERAMEESIREMFRADNDSWGTTLGQGLPGIVGVKDRDGYFEISWDTAYGYRENGISCTELHVSAMLFLEEALPEGVRITEWENEYAGDWNDAENGIGPGVPEFLGGGDDALEWFSEVSTHIMSGVYPFRSN